MNDAALIKTLIRKIDDLASQNDDEGEVQNLDTLDDTIDINLQDTIAFTSHFYRFCGTFIAGEGMKL
jgi:hypothetical protein